MIKVFDQDPMWNKTWGKIFYKQTNKQTKVQVNKILGNTNRKLEASPDHKKTLSELFDNLSVFPVLTCEHSVKASTYSHFYLCWKVKLHLTTVLMSLLCFTTLEYAGFSASRTDGV